MADEGEEKAATPPAEGDEVAKPAARREQTEWTASDARGPLSSADAEQAGESQPIEPPHAESSFDAPGAGGHDESANAHASAIEPSLTQPEAAPASDGRRPIPVVPLVLALIVGAVIGAGSAAAIYAYGGSSETSQVAPLAQRVDALEKRPDPQPEIDALKSELAARKTPPFDPSPLQAKIAAVQSDVDALKRKPTANPQLDSKVAALGGSVDALKAQGADVKSLDGKVDTLAATLDGLKKQDAATEAGLASLQDGQKALQARITSAPALAVVADSLVEAITAGKPYVNQVSALGPLGADPAKVAVLKENADKGVPSAQALAQAFAPLADPIMATASKAAPNAGLMDRLKSGMASMVSVRSADATTGDDVGSRVSRIEADLVHDDVDGAYATWAGLPPDAKAKSEAWGALAKTHVEAMDAARALQQQAIAALGARKS